MFLSALTSCSQKHSAGGLFQHERTQSKIDSTMPSSATTASSASVLGLQGGAYFPQSFTVALQDVLQLTDDIETYPPSFTPQANAENEPGNPQEIIQPCHLCG